MVRFARCFGVVLGIVLGGLGGPLWAEEGWFRLPFGGGVSESQTVGRGGASGATVMEQVRAGNGGQEFKAARVRWLDKQTNRRQTLVLLPDVAQEVGVVAGKSSVLSLKMVRCLGDYGAAGAQQLGQDVAWLEVRESGREVPWFAGWMFNTLPEVATLDHPRYDLQLLGCGETPRKRGGMARPKGQPVVDEVPVTDSEAPRLDDEAPGEDPFYVPGVAPRDVEPEAGPAVIEPQAGPVGGGGVDEVPDYSAAQDELQRLMEGR